MLPPEGTSCHTSENRAVTQIWEVCQHCHTGRWSTRQAQPAFGNQPSPWEPIGNGRWVTWPASHLLSTPLPSIPCEATPPSTCWPTVACLDGLGRTFPKRWQRCVSTEPVMHSFICRIGIGFLRNILFWLLSRFFLSFFFFFKEGWLFMHATLILKIYHQDANSYIV